MSEIGFPYISVSDINNSIAYMEGYMYNNWSTYLDTLDYIREHENILSSSIPCDIDTLIWLKRNLHKIDLTTLTELATSKFYDISVMNILLCVISSVVYSYSNDESIRYMFNRLTVLSKRDNNTVLTSSISGNTPDIVLKVSNNPMYNNNNIHEIVVGIYGTNRLRSIIPNFAYVLGGFRCTKPIHIPTTNTVSLWCRNYELPVVYTIYENIYPSVTLKEYITQPTTSPDDVLKVYLQILLALRIARDKIQFTHYDLHDENILIRKTKLDRFYIRYPYYDTSYYIETDNIPTIIDYGYSHIVYNNEHYGKFGLLKYSILYNSTFDAYDHYKLLMFMYYNSMRGNIHDMLLELAFNLFLEPDDTEIERKRELVFQLPNLDNVRKIRHEAVIDYILNRYPHLVTKTPDPTIPIIQCCDTNNIGLLLRPDVQPRIINLFNYRDIGGDIIDINLTSEVNNAVEYLRSLIEYTNQVHMELDNSDYIRYFDSLVVFLSNVILLYEYINREISLISLLYSINMSQYVEVYKDIVIEHITYINNILDVVHINQDIISKPGSVYTTIVGKEQYTEFLRSRVWLLPKFE